MENVFQHNRKINPERGNILDITQNREANSPEGLRRDYML